MTRASSDASFWNKSENSAGVLVFAMVCIHSFESQNDPLALEIAGGEVLFHVQGEDVGARRARAAFGRAVRGFAVQGRKAALHLGPDVRPRSGNEPEELAQPGQEIAVENFDDDERVGRFFEEVAGGFQVAEKRAPRELFPVPDRTEALPEDEDENEPQEEELEKQEKKIAAERKKTGFLSPSPNQSPFAPREREEEEAEDETDDSSKAMGDRKWSTRQLLRR